MGAIMRPSAIAYMAILLSCYPCCTAQESASMIDPLFHISYTPKQVSFEVAPAKIVDNCEGMRSRNKIWVYAHMKSNDVEYYIVSGFVNAYPDVPEPGARILDDEADEIGTVIAFSGNKCVSVSADWFLGGLSLSNQKDYPPTNEYKELLPKFWVRVVCNRQGNCDSLLKSSVEEAIMEGLMADALKRYIKAFGGEEQLISALSAVHKKPYSDDLYPIIRKHLGILLENQR